MNFKILKVKIGKGRTRNEVRAWDGSGDRRVEWRRRFESRADAQNFIDDQVFKERESKLEIKRNGGDPMLATTFTREHEFWAKCKLPELSPSYRLDVISYWKEFEPLLGAKLLGDLKPQVIREIDAGLKVRGNSRATIKKKVAWLKSVLNFAVENERIPFSPIAKVRTARPSKPDLHFWEASEASSFLWFAWQKYLSGSENEHVYLAYLTSLNTALRAGELWALKPRCLKASMRQMIVVEQFDLRAKCFRQLKGKEARNVPLQPTLMEALQEFITRRAIKPDELIFSSECGTPVDHNNFKNRFFNRDVTAWKGTRITFHGLRHTAATLMLDAGVDIRTVQDVLGHKDLQTTMRYVHALGKNVGLASLSFSVAPAAPRDDLPPDPVEPTAQVARRQLSIVQDA